MVGGLFKENRDPVMHYRKNYAALFFFKKTDKAGMGYLIHTLTTGRISN